MDVMAQVLFLHTQPAEFFGALVRKASNLTAANFNVAFPGSAVVWDTETYDIGDFHSTSSNTSRLTIPAELNGHYVIVSGQVHCQNVTGTAFVTATIYKNGAIFDGSSSMSRTPGNFEAIALSAMVQVCTHPVQVSTGNFFELYFRAGDTSGDIVAASSSFNIYDLGTSIEGALVKNSVDLTLQNYNFGLLAWDAEVYDTDGFHDNSTNNSRLTVPALYNNRYGIVRSSVKLSASTPSTSMINKIIKNSGDFRGMAYIGTNCGNDGASYYDCQTGPILLATGDYFDNQVFCQDTSVTRDANGSFFSIQILPTTFRGVMAALSANVLADFRVPTALTWNGVSSFDTDGAHDSTWNPTAIVVPEIWDGKYGVLHAGAIYSVGTTDLTTNSSVSVSFYKNGVLFAGSGAHQSSTTAIHTSAYSPAILLTAGDEFTVKLYSSDASATIGTNSYFSLYLLSTPAALPLPPTARLNQQYLEVIDSGNGKVRLSQQTIDVINSGMPKVRLGQQYIEVITNN